MKHISFVVPVFNEEANLREFYQRLTDIMSALPYEYDLTFVDDGSKDSSAVILAELVRNDERVQAYLLSRNYGHQLALTCGLDYADGDAVITMDGDLQHPPELVPDLLRLWEDGNEIVQTIRLSTENVSFMKRFSSAVYYNSSISCLKWKSLPEAAISGLWTKKLWRLFVCIVKERALSEGLSIP